jgi:hypothetical protein
MQEGQGKIRVKVSGRKNKVVMGMGTVFSLI